MADRKISDLTALTTPASGDYLPIVDISEAAAASKNKRITIEELMRGVPDGTAAAPGIAFETDPNTGIYRPGADQLAVATNGTGRLFVDASGNVGIGTNATSEAKTDIFNTSDSSVTLLRVGSNNVANTSLCRLLVNSSATGGVSLITQGFGSAAAGEYLALGTNNTERLRITSAGLVGVGASAPATNLQVNAASDVGIALSNSSSVTSGNRGSIYMFNSAVSTVGTIRFAAVTDNVGTEIQFYTRPAAGSLTQTMTLDSTGRLGIGTTSPSYPLHVQYDIGVFASGCNVLLSAAGGAFGTLGTTTNHALLFKTDNAERVRIDTSGRLLVGTSTDTTARLVVKGSAGGGDDGINVISGSTTLGSKAAIFFSPSTSGSFSTGSAIKTERLSPDGSDLQFYTCTALGSSPTERMRIDNLGRIFTYNANTGNNSLTVASAAAAGTAVATFIGVYSATGVNTGTSSFIVWTNGNVQNTNNSYTAISDIKLKENIVDANSQWDDLKALRVRNYNLKEGQTHTQIGLVAQEVEPISPGLVYESPDRDEEGTDLGTVTKSVNYSVLYMKAVKALQEAMERIEQLEQRLTDAGIA
jgi:hypothetical protein